jgi:uncharacterized RDD family membrane protein YckC
MNANTTLASISSRFTAQFIDGLIAMTLAAATYVAAKELELALEWLLVVWIAYLLLCDALPKGQSLGKIVTKIAVVHVRTGEPCTLWRSVVRNLSLGILGMFDCAPIVSKKRRRIGDYLAGTMVVNRNALSPAEALSEPEA